MIYEVDKSIDKAKFIISNVYYYLKNFYYDKYINSNTNDLKEYLNNFKNKFEKQNVSNSFSFNLLNKYIYDKKFEEQKINDNTYYDLLYKMLINIILEEKVSAKVKDLIDSFISLRNCFIFLEYLYLFIKEKPETINHYIIKINISLLLDILQRASKRLINSNEFFYLNLIELKGLFPNIEYTPSQFIKNLDKMLYVKYLNNVNLIKSKKLSTLIGELTRLMDTLSEFNDNKVCLLYDYLDEKCNNIILDKNNKNMNVDFLINKYIIEVNNPHNNKKLEQILDEIDFENNIIPEFNYLYLIALNNYNQIKSKNNDSENKILKTLKEENISNKEEEKEDIKISNINNEGAQEENDKLKINKEKIIKIEELKLEFKEVVEKEISELKQEKLDKDIDKYLEFIKKNFTYEEVLNLKADNIYNILLFLEIYKNSENKIFNLDYIYIEEKNKFISLVKNLNKIKYEWFYDIISEKHFQEEIIKILNSKSLKDYLNNYRFYEEIKEDDKDYKKKQYEFQFDEKGKNYIENFSKEYNKLMEELSNGIFFTNLFRLKYLPFKIKAFVNFNLKIIINSLYYEFNENISENNRKIIFKAALKIIIIHEIMHIMKYLKNDANFNTPRKRETGKMLINYLFGHPIIMSINLDEAQKINDIKYWNDLNLLRNIFPKEENSVENKEFKNKNIDHIDLYIADDYIEEEEIPPIYEENIGIDID